MSHFTLMCFGENTKEQLIPFHEYDGEEYMKPYLEFIDIEDELIHQYNTDSISKIQLSDGSICDMWDDKFKVYKKGNKWNYSLEYPIDSQEIKLKFTELYKTFEEFSSDYNGNKQRDPEFNRYGYWRNPNGKWDWYQIGGRWTGFFRLKRNPIPKQFATEVFNLTTFTDKDIEMLVNLMLDDFNQFIKEMEIYDIATISRITEYISKIGKSIIPEHKIGEPGVFGTKAGFGTADSCLKKHIDIDYMRIEAGNKAKTLWEEAYFIAGESIKDFIPWKTYHNKFKNDEITIEKARKQYNNQEIKKLFNLSKDMCYYDPESFNITLEEYVSNAQNNAIIPFAFIKDGKWYEKGEMGWLGIVTGEQDQNQWNKEFNKMFDELNDETLVTIYDCHI